MQIKAQAFPWIILWKESIIVSISLPKDLRRKCNSLGSVQPEYQRAQGKVREKVDMADRSISAHYKWCLKRKGGSLSSPS